MYVDCLASNSRRALTLFFILFCYVFEVQLLLQIIINRTAVFTERRTTAVKLKWGTAIIITTINAAVFCIWIPTHMDPPVNQTCVSSLFQTLLVPTLTFFFFSYVKINKYWDRTSKVLILLVDAGLNWYFIHVVSARLVKRHGLKKYKSLVTYYTRLGIVSICMDVRLIRICTLQLPVLEADLC
jgi:hypothetical protein